MKVENNGDDPVVSCLEKVSSIIKSELPTGHGFILLVGKCDEDNPPVYFASDQSKEDSVKVLKGLLFRWGIDDKWMQDAL